MQMIVLLKLVQVPLSFKALCSPLEAFPLESFLRLCNMSWNILKLSLYLRYNAFPINNVAFIILIH